MMFKRTLLALAAASSVMAGAFAQPAPVPSRVRGTVTAIDGASLAVKTRDGRDVTIALSPDVRIVAVSKADIANVEPGSFIGCTAVPGPDGMLKALEIHVFPPSMRGTGEGSYAWDLGSNSTMTNGTVGDLVVSEGRVMTVKYDGNGTGEKKILVPEEVPIVSMQPADRSLLTPGAHVIATVTKTADGSMTASRVNVGVGGTVPPM